MNAIVLPGSGPARDARTSRVPVRRPGRGQALLRTRAATVAPDLPPPWPMSGEVVMVGAGVTEWSRGDRVGAISGTPQTDPGWLGTDFAVIPASNLHPIPANVSFLSAAAVVHPFGTAWEALFHRGHLGMGERVVVIGTAHPAGPAAVQIARWRKSRVVVVADGHQAPRLSALGADRVVSRSAPNLAEHVIAGLGGEPANVVIDVAGAVLQPLQRMLGDEGRLVIVAANEPQLLDSDLLINRRARVLGSKAHFDPVDLHHILKLLSDGTFVPVIDSIFRFSHAGQAIRRIESADGMGSVLVVPDGLYESGDEPAHVVEEV